MAIDLNASGIQYLASNSPQDISEFQMTLNLGMFPGGLPTNPLIGRIAQKSPTPGQEDTFDVEYPGVLQSYPYDKNVGILNTQFQRPVFYKRIAAYTDEVVPLEADMTLSVGNIIRQTSMSIPMAVEAYQFNMLDKFMGYILGIAYEKLSRGLHIDAEKKVDQPKTLAQDNPFIYTMPKVSPDWTGDPADAPIHTELTYGEWDFVARQVSPSSTLITDDLGGSDTILMSEQDWALLTFKERTYGADNTPRNASAQGLWDPNNPSIWLGGRPWSIAKYGERSLADRRNAMMGSHFITTDTPNPGYSFRYIPFIKKNACIMSPTIVSMPNWVPRDTNFFTWYRSQLHARFAAMRVSGAGLGFIKKRFKTDQPDIPNPAAEPMASKPMITTAAAKIIPNIT
jgi:hypothetical protein